MKRCLTLNIPGRSNTHTHATTTYFIPTSTKPNHPRHRNLSVFSGRQVHTNRATTHMYNSESSVTPQVHNGGKKGKGHRSASSSKARDATTSTSRPCSHYRITDEIFPTTTKALYSMWESSWQHYELTNKAIFNQRWKMWQKSVLHRFGGWWKRRESNFHL